MSNGREGPNTDHQLVPMNGGPVRIFPSKRICFEGTCATVLSIYNGSTFCALHEPPGKLFVKHALWT